MNSADPAVAEDAEHFSPSGGVGRLARNGQAFHSIVEALQKLEDNRTLLIRRGQPAALLETREDAPRVMVLNADWPDTLSGAAPPEKRLDAPREARRYAGDWMFTGPASALPEAFQVFRAAARKHFGGSLAGRLIVAAGMGGMGGAQALAATLNGGAFLGIDADAARIKRREKAGFCEVMVNNLDEALRILKNAVRKREPASVGLIGNAAEILPELAQRGVLPDLLADQTPADDLSCYIPRGFTLPDARELQERDPSAYQERALDSIAAQVRAMLELKKLGALVFEFGNGIRAQALARGVAEAAKIPDFVSEYLLADLAQGRGLLTAIALSGDPGDLAQVDAACFELFPQSELSEWIGVARKRPSAGLPARSLWMTAGEAGKLGAAVDGIVRNGAIKAPVALGRSIYVAASAKPAASSPPPQSTNSGAMHDGRALADSPALAAIVQAASGASWVGLQAAVVLGKEYAAPLSVAVVADGTPASAGRIARVFASDFANDFAAGAGLFAS